MANESSRAWSTAETKLLISVWSRDKIRTRMETCYRKKDIFSEMSGVLSEHGYHRSWQQCQTKIRDLRYMYRKTKDRKGLSGGGRVTCQFYQELEEILGKRPASSPAVISQSRSNAPGEQQDDSGQDSIQSTSDRSLSISSPRPGTSADTDTLDSKSSGSELSVSVPPVPLPSLASTSFCPGDQFQASKRPLKHVGGKRAKKSLFQRMTELNDAEREKETQRDKELRQLDRECDIERRRLDLESAWAIREIGIQQHADNMRAIAEFRGMIAELSEQVGLLRCESVPQQAPMNSQSMNSQSMNSQSMNSQSMNSQSMNSQSMNSQSMNSQSMNSQSINSQSMNSQSMNSQSINSQSINSQSINSQSINSQSVLSLLNEPAHSSTLQ